MVVFCFCTDLLRFSGSLRWPNAVMVSSGSEGRLLLGVRRALLQLRIKPLFDVWIFCASLLLFSLQPEDGTNPTPLFYLSFRSLMAHLDRLISSANR
ncbi:hypothetical protein MRB53_018750 [Persea americana]|uniref:Uncharacterized protein n=1 Tax=Persea americana TaxID=3435 RepID=A0ACC2M8B4_PERAE|nr:hypothetical protein MRB53_018750 [Persea americana]